MLPITVAIRTTVVLGFEAVVAVCAVAALVVVVVTVVDVVSVVVAVVVAADKAFLAVVVVTVVAVVFVVAVVVVPADKASLLSAISVAGKQEIYFVLLYTFGVLCSLACVNDVTHSFNSLFIM